MKGDRRRPGAAQAARDQRHQRQHRDEDHGAPEPVLPGGHRAMAGIGAGPARNTNAFPWIHSSIIWVKSA